MGHSQKNIPSLFRTEREQEGWAGWVGVWAAENFVFGCCFLAMALKRRAVIRCWTDFMRHIDFHRSLVLLEKIGVLLVATCGVNLESALDLS